MAKITKRAKAAAFLAMGAEPEGSLVDSKQDDYRSNLIQALNWYSQHKVSKDAIAYLSAWAKKNNPKKAAVLKFGSPAPTLGWLARLESRGASLSKKDRAHLVRFFDELEEPVAEKNEGLVPKRANVQDAIKEKTAYVLGDFEGLLDEVILRGPAAEVKTSTEVKTFMQTNEYGKVYVSAIADWARRKMAEFVKAFKNKDEGYLNLSSAKQQKSILVFLKSCVEGSEEYSQHKKANRKPRVRKALSPVKQVSKMKYQQAFEDFAIKSINPTEIIGAKQLWVYNSKYRKLGVYKTDSSIGLQVKGASIQNYDPDQSLQKTLRKPLEGVTQCLEAGKIALRKLLDSFNAKAQPMSGRINSETILLRVVK